jgi:hypothetical protein
MAGFEKISAAGLCLFLMSGVSKADETSGGQATLRIKTRVYNMAKVKLEILTNGLIEAGTIFRKIGIEIEWKQCPCNSLVGVAEFQLRVIPTLIPTARGIPQRGHLGYAAASEEGGVLATIFYDRVEDLTLVNTPSTVLGYAIAHEMGHLLLGKTLTGGRYHSDSGIMRAKWDRNDLKGRTESRMEFAPEDAERLRTRVALWIKRTSELEGETDNQQSALESLSRPSLESLQAPPAESN